MKDVTTFDYDNIFMFLYSIVTNYTQNIVHFHLGLSNSVHFYYYVFYVLYRSLPWIDFEPRLKLCEIDVLRTYYILQMQVIYKLRKHKRIVIVFRYEYNGLSTTL